MSLVILKSMCVDMDIDSGSGSIIASFQATRGALRLSIFNAVVAGDTLWCLAPAGQHSLKRV